MKTNSICLKHLNCKQFIWSVQWELGQAKYNKQNEISHTSLYKSTWKDIQDISNGKSKLQNKKHNEHSLLNISPNLFI